MSVLYHTYIILCVGVLSQMFQYNVYNIRNFHTSYGSHMQTSLHGAIFGFWGINVYYTMVCLAMNLSYCNKSEITWKNSHTLSKIDFLQSIQSHVQLLMERKDLHSPLNQPLFKRKPFYFQSMKRNIFRHLI